MHKITVYTEMYLFTDDERDEKIKNKNVFSYEFEDVGRLALVNVM